MGDAVEGDAVVGAIVDVVGAEVIADGVAVGDNDGVDVVGAAVGALVGITLGVGVGTVVGTLVGTAVGSCVGARDGAVVPTVGATVGVAEGDFVVTVNEFAVHCIFVSAAVGPHDDVPVA